jgi:hypothetical protein
LWAVLTRHISTSLSAVNIHPLWHFRCAKHEHCNGRDRSFSFSDYLDCRRRNSIRHTVHSKHSWRIIRYPSSGWPLFTNFTASFLLNLDSFENLSCMAVVSLSFLSGTSSALSKCD